MRNQALNNSLSLFASAVFLELLPVHLADYQFLGFNGSVNTLFNAHDTLLRNEPRKEMLADERFSLPLLRVRITLPPEGLHGNFVSLAVIAPGQRQRRSWQHFVPDLDQHIVAVEADIPGQRAIGLLDQQIGAFGGKTHRRGIGFPFGNADLHDRAAPHRIDRVALFHFEMQPQSPFLC